MSLTTSFLMTCIFAVGSAYYDSGDQLIPIQKYGFFPRHYRQDSLLISYANNSKLRIWNTHLALLPQGLPAQPQKRPLHSKDQNQLECNPRAAMIWGSLLHKVTNAIAHRIDQPC
jgi:hypothetical protein